MQHLCLLSVASLGTLLLNLRTHTSLALFLDEAAKLGNDVSDQARPLFGRGATNDQVGKAFSDLRGEVWHVDRVTGLERVAQTLFNEIVDLFTKVGHLVHSSK